ncbi:MAG: hypothetical protein P8X97_08555, partial [Candidatus Bathyarchaeota archaeon]
ILKQIYQLKHDQIGLKSLAENVDQMKILGTQLISDSTIDFHHFGVYFIQKQEILFTSFSEYFDKLI